MRRVVIVAFPGVQTLDVTGPAEVLRAATKLHPPGYVEAARVESARIALETGDLPVENVARQSGFGTVETMRRAFRRRVGVSPVDYRTRFRRQAA